MTAVERDEQLRHFVREAASHLSVALTQAIPSDDQIIIGHVSTAHELLTTALRAPSEQKKAG